MTPPPPPPHMDFVFFLRFKIHFIHPRREIEYTFLAHHISYFPASSMGDVYAPDTKISQYIN